MKRTSWFLAIGLLAACGGGGKKDPTGPTGGGDGTGGGEVAGGETGGGGEDLPAMPQAVGNPSTDVISRSVLFGNPERTAAQISPDGKHLAWLAPKEGVLNVWVAPVNDLNAAKPVTADAARPVQQYFWAFDKKHLLYMQDKGGDENFHLWQVDLATDKATDLTPMENTRAIVVGVSWKKPNTVMVGLNNRDPQLHDLYEVTLGTGAMTMVYENKDGFTDFTVDDDYKLRFAGKPTPDGGQLIQMFDAKAKTWSDYETIGGDDALTTGILGFNKKGDQLYMLDSRDRDTAALFLTDIKTKKKKLLQEDARADVSGAMMSPKDHSLQAVSVTYDRQEWIAKDKKVEADFKAIAKLDTGEFNVASRTLDDSVWLVTMSGDTMPGKYYLWERAKKKGTYLFTTRPDLEGKPLAPMHSITDLKSRDGLTLVSYLTLPNAADADKNGKADKPVPAVLLVHGGPWARDNWGANPIHQLLANRGYAVLSVNYRGSTGFGKKFLNAANGEWGKKMHDDLLDAVRYLVDQQIAPADKICIMGGSYGGYATLAGLTLTPDTFACGVDIVGPSNIVTLVKSIPPYWAPLINVFKARVGDWDTKEGYAALMDASPLTHVAKIKKPLLIGQGANDPRVKQAESDQIVKAMQKARIPVTYALFPDEGHGFARPENSLAFFAVTEAFLSAHLGGVYQKLTKEEVTASTIQIKVGKEGIPGWPE
jgi:dipeptidyl aminopeptidase/acylaminoacyl peptidase